MVDMPAPEGEPRVHPRVDERGAADARARAGSGAALAGCWRRGGAARAGAGLHAPGDQHGDAVPQLRPADERSGAGGRGRPDAGGGTLRARARGALLDLRRLVDPLGHAGLHPAQLVGGAHRHHGGAKSAVLQFAPAARQDRGRRRRARRPRPRADRRGAVGQPRRRRGDGDPPVRRRPVAERADRRRRRGPVAGFSRGPAPDARGERDLGARRPHPLALARPGARRAVSAREQTIIKERRLRDDARTLEELGHKLGISKERVRQIEHRALEKLKSSLLQRSALPNHLS